MAYERDVIRRLLCFLRELHTEEPQGEGVMESFAEAENHLSERAIMLKY